jgi:ATP-dependent helicase Lhr and Lhr-like helicase
LGAFELLRPEIKSYIWDQGWPELRPIQEAAISHVQSSDNNLILAAPTASGKTEAAFLPAINSIKTWDSGVQIVYISPLIALINDQFKRITELCQYLNIPVTSWHGEASQAQKRHLLDRPQGILLITPESIEALLIRRPAQARTLFSDVSYVVIDELHSFLDTKRGVHLQSLLHRLRKLGPSHARYIGLSATLSRESYTQAKHFFGTQQDTTVLADTTQNELTTSLLHYNFDGTGVPATIIDDIYQKSLQERMLVFPNARGKVEEIAVGLQKRTAKDHSLVRYFAHHASVNKDLRLDAENFAKAARDELFTICCTSTLELGIDIGAVDSVAQVEATHTVASLAQRLGRSGRQQKHSILHLYSTNGWSLLQAIASVKLFEQGILEPVRPILKPFDVLFQQVLSVLLEHSGCSRSQLTELLFSAPCWQQITLAEFDRLVDHMIEKGFIEHASNELIVGLAAERIVESSGFYAHFEDRQEYRVLNDGQHIGDMPHTPAIDVGSNVFLAAKIWKITGIDDQTKKIFVQHANDGKPPVYGGEGGEVSHLVRQAMKATLYELDSLPDYADPANVLPALREVAQAGALALARPDAKLRIQKHGNDKESITTFAGTRINRTLVMLLKMLNAANVQLNDYEATIVSPALKQLLTQLVKQPPTVRDLETWLRGNSSELLALQPGSKYARYLPEQLQIQAVIHDYLDLPAATEFVTEEIELPLDLIGRP